MGVCRGRISEGLDFSDKAARCVIVVGVPYPQLTDPRVILKKEFLDLKLTRRRPQGDGDAGKIIRTISGRDWYN